jgi:hypothetical protein
MKFEDIVGIDCREAENKQKLRKALTKTKWLERFTPDEIDIEVLEKLYKKVANKYPVRIAYIQNASNDSMLVMMKNIESNAWIYTAYFISFWECMAKVILVMYGYIIMGINFKDKDRRWEETE